MVIGNSKIYDYYLGNMEGNHYSYYREKKNNCQEKAKNGHIVTSKPENGHLRKTSAKLEMKKLLEFIIQEVQNKTGYAMEKNTSKYVLISKPKSCLKLALTQNFIHWQKQGWSREGKILSIAISLSILYLNTTLLKFSLIVIAFPGFCGSRVTWT